MRFGPEATAPGFDATLALEGCQTYHCVPSHQVCQITLSALRTNMSSRLAPQLVRTGEEPGAVPDGGRAAVGDRRAIRGSAQDGVRARMVAARPDADAVVAAIYEGLVDVTVPPDLADTVEAICSTDPEVTFGARRSPACGPR